MIKHLYHEEIGGGYAMRQKIVIDTSEIAPGEFETMALNGQGDELDVAKSSSREEAEREFRAMIQRHAGALQAAFYQAGMTEGKRYTMVFLGEFGFPVAMRMTFHSAKLTTYAQYDDAVELVFTPYKKRNAYRMHLYNKSFLVYNDWRVMPTDAAYNVERTKTSITRISKYGCFDERFIEDIKAMWPDYIVAYDHDRVYRRDEDAAAENEHREQAVEQSGAFALLPGINVVIDAGSTDAPCVDMDADDFARLYAIDAEQIESPEDRLTWALKRAAIASVAHIAEHDGGTCNFDSPALDFSACGMSKADAERAIKGVGLHCREWQPFKNRRGDDGKIVKAPTFLVISGFQSGQGNRHTHMAEAFCRSMNADGFETQMYYQMD